MTTRSGSCVSGAAAMPAVLPNHVAPSAARLDPVTPRNDRRLWCSVLILIFPPASANCSADLSTSPRGGRGTILGWITPALMDANLVVVATLTWARSEGEEAILRRSLEQLARHN